MITANEALVLSRRKAGIEAISVVHHQEDTVKSTKEPFLLLAHCTVVFAAHNPTLPHQFSQIGMHLCEFNAKSATSKSLKRTVN